jgi:hypothetical protein
MINSYSTGIVTGAGAGGVTSFNNSIISNCFWDVQTSGIATSVAGTGLTTLEMKTQAMFTGWDFSSIWNIKSGATTSYPYLRNNEQNPIPGE